MVNKVILVGNVGIDPEVRTTESGVKVARIRLATTERLFDRQANEAKEHTEWHTVTLWRGLADVVDKYVRKGTQIYVEGRLRTREWMDKDNNKRTGRCDEPAGTPQRQPGLGRSPFRVWFATASPGLRTTCPGGIPAAGGAATRRAGRSGRRSRRPAVLMP